MKNKIKEIKEETKFMTSPASDKAKTEISEYWAKICLAMFALIFMGFIIFYALLQTITYTY